MNRSPNSPTRHDWLRYGLWLLMAQTAFANRQHYRMFTTWLPHLLTNTLSLLLPDAVRLIFPAKHRPANVVEDTLITMVRDNPNYAIYVAPLALGYIVSHPRFNIYKGDLADIRLAGFGLDAIPHSATAFGFAALVADTLDTMGDRLKDGRAPYNGVLVDLLRWGDNSPELISLALLALVTLNWEYGEYTMHQYEMKRIGDVKRINMQWSMDDTLRDVGANLFGWLVAVLWRRTRRAKPGSVRRA